MKTQNQRILDRLLAIGKGITSMEAAHMSPPIMRLSERIRELEKQGVLFLKTYEKTGDKRGKYTRYWLKSLCGKSDCAQAWNEDANMETDKKRLKKWAQNTLPNESAKRVFGVDKIDHKNDFFCPHCEVFTGKNRYCPKCKQLCF